MHARSTGSQPAAPHAWVIRARDSVIAFARSAPLTAIILPFHAASA